MIFGLLRTVKFPNGSLLPIRIPVVLPTLLPAEQHRLMLPLVGASSQHKALLLPDTAAGKIESGIMECFAEIQPLCICMEHINGSIRLHALLHIHKSRKKELIKLSILHMVILDISGSSLIIHVIRRICHHKVCFLPFHQHLVCLRQSGIPTDYPVPA